MKRLGVLLIVLAGIAAAGIGCGNSFDSTRLIVINRSSDTVFVEVDEHADGDIDVRVTLAPGSQADWVLDSGWAVVLVDGEVFEIFLDDQFDGIFEITDD